MNLEQTLDKKLEELRRPLTTTLPDGKIVPLPVFSGDDLGVKAFADIPAESVRYLFFPYIPRRKVTIFGAYPGIGKTFVLCYGAARLSRGLDFFGSLAEEGKQGRTIYFSCEDGAGDTLRPRLEACGADLKNVFSVDCMTNKIQINSPKVEKIIDRYRPDLIIFDPLQNFMDKRVNINCATDTRAAFQSLIDWAQKYDCAVVIASHLNKNSNGDFITRLIGSMDIAGVPRSILGMGTVDAEGDVKFLSHEKASLSALGRTQLFTIDFENGGIIPQGETTKRFDDYAVIKAGTRNREAPAVDAAEQFLREQLRDGARSSGSIRLVANARGITESALKRAAKRIGIVTTRLGFQGKTEWSLPERNFRSGDDEDIPFD